MISVNELLKDHQLYHSDFQIDNFITLRSGGTAYGQYKQALRELDKRRRGLKGLYAEKALLQVDIDELEAKLEYAKKGDLEARRNRIKQGQKIMAMEDLDRNIQDTEREFIRFYSQATALKSEIGELTDENRELLEKEMWAFNMKKLAAMDIATLGVLQKNTLELILAAPEPMRFTLLEELKLENRDTLINWLEHSHKQAFEVKLLDVPIQKLLEG